jgi:hypothetical protein
MVQPLTRPRKATSEIRDVNTTLQPINGETGKPTIASRVTDALQGTGLCVPIAPGFRPPPLSLNRHSLHLPSSLPPSDRPVLSAPKCHFLLTEGPFLAIIYVGSLYLIVSFIDRGNHFAF